MRIAIVALSLLVASPVLADDVERAKKHFEVAELHFGEGEFSQAIAQYRKAHALSKEPVLLFNIGLCFENLGEAADAIESFKAYLAAAPAGAKAGEARYRLGKLEKELADAASTDRPEPKPEPEPEPLSERPPPEPVALTLRLGRDAGTYRISLVASGGKTLDCPATTFVTPCVLRGVPPGPARLTVEHEGERATATFNAPAGSATRRIDFTPLDRGYKNVLLYGGIGSLVLSAASFVGAGVAGIESDAFPLYMVGGVGLVFTGVVGVTLGGFGIGGETKPASVSVR